MQFPESWLREFCNPPIDTDELAALLTMSGMEVEELRPVAPPFDKVVVAEVLAVDRHPITPGHALTDVRRFAVHADAQCYRIEAKHAVVVDGIGLDGA